MAVYAHSHDRKPKKQATLSLAQRNDSLELVAIGDMGQILTCVAIITSDEGITTTSGCRENLETHGYYLDIPFNGGGDVKAQ